MSKKLSASSLSALQVFAGEDACALMNLFRQPLNNNLFLQLPLLFQIVAVTHFNSVLKFDFVFETETFKF